MTSLSVLAYDPDVSYNAVMYSAASYCLISDIMKWECGRPCMLRRGMKSIVKIEHKEFDVFGFVAYNEVDKEVVVAFRGTNGIDVKNWYMNLQGDKVPYEDVAGAQVHLGWYKGWKNIREETLNTVRDMIWNHQPQTILITGHSLGGVLATFAAIEIKLHSGFLGYIALYT